ncbi:hypothetical protein ACJJIF_13210 [Microbulbifer sp. SSSA002]|uniref:hypothetical protein n=1 Tax=unclassified Microbulbifer TaxID=2619833 RepID=UPI00403981F7
MFSNEIFKRELMVAGNAAGKPETITSQAEPIYHEMISKARRGNFWAQISVNGLHQFVSGGVHQNNIFIKRSAVRRDGAEEFYMILPGCKATVEKLPSNTFKILFLEANLNFYELQKQEDRSGLFLASFKSGKWNTRFKRKKGIEEKTCRKVAIVDGSYADADEAAKVIFKRLAKAPFTSGANLEATGYDLHYTPKLEKLPGLKSYRNALEDKRIHESALLLAKTMYDARETIAVCWISEFGGSAVLTQAMKILADQDVRLENHFVYMHRPTTPPLDAIKAAHKLGLNIDRHFSKTGLTDWVGNKTNFRTILARWRNAEDIYKGTQAIIDTLALVKSAQGVAVLSVAAAILAGLSIFFPAIPEILKFVGAYTVSAVVALKMANALTRGFAPRFHNKHIQGRL